MDQMIPILKLLPLSIIILLTVCLSEPYQELLFLSLSSPAGNNTDGVVILDIITRSVIQHCTAKTNIHVEMLCFFFWYHALWVSLCGFLEYGFFFCIFTKCKVKFMFMNRVLETRNIYLRRSPVRSPSGQVNIVPRVNLKDLTLLEVSSSDFCSGRPRGGSPVRCSFESFLHLEFSWLYLYFSHKLQQLSEDRKDF